MSTMSSRVAADRRDPVLVDAAEVGRLTGLSAPSVYRLNRAGRMPKGVRVGRSVRWRLEEVVGWARDGCPASGVETGSE